MPRDLPELRASHEDRDRVVDILRTAGDDGRLTAEELDARVERALSARTQGELAALVADLSAATATKDVLVVKQTGGKWTRAGRWTVPNRIEVRTKLCRVTFDFTDAVITSRTVRIDMDMQHGKLVIVGAPGIVIDADGLNLVSPRPSSARTVPSTPGSASSSSERSSTRRSSSGCREPVLVENPVRHDCIYGTWHMIFVIDQSVSRAPRQGSLSCCRKVVCSRRLQRTEPGHLRWACHAGRADCEARRFGDIG
jgi:hypothetical protein